MTAVPSDYDTDPGRRRAWRAPRDVFEMVAPELRGPVLDIGCGEGRLREELGDAPVRWVGVDDSQTQLAECPYRPVVRAEMRALPFRDGSFAEAAHLWCLYHLDDPTEAIAEARRVLGVGGRYFACTSARANDPELVVDGYPPCSFDAEEAVEIVGSVFPGAGGERWDDRFFALETREDVRDYCRHAGVDPARAEEVELPLWLTKRGVLVRAQRPVAS